MRKQWIFSTPALLTLILMLGSFSLISPGNMNSDICQADCRLIDGWYTAIIKYKNSGTDAHTSNELDVFVACDRVIKFTLEETGSYYDAYNDTSYIYLGGQLDIIRDEKDNIVTASTTVIIDEGDDSLKEYWFSLEW